MRTDVRRNSQRPTTAPGMVQSPSISPITISGKFNSGDAPKTTVLVAFNTTPRAAVLAAYCAPRSPAPKKNGASISPAPMVTPLTTP